MQNYTEEEKKDITERTEKANAYLKELNLVPAAQVVKVNLGDVDPKFNSVFGDLIQVYLADTKYPKTEKKDANA